MSQNALLFFQLPSNWDVLALATMPSLPSMIGPETVPPMSWRE